MIIIFEINNWKFIICDSYIVIIKINSRKIREYNISLSESHSCFESCVRLISKYICKYVSPSIEIRLIYEYYCTNQSKTNSVTKRTHPTNRAYICRQHIFPNNYSRSRRNTIRCPLGVCTYATRHSKIIDLIDVAIR